MNFTSGRSSNSIEEGLKLHQLVSENICVDFDRAIETMYRKLRSLGHPAEGPEHPVANEGFKALSGPKTHDLGLAAPRTWHHIGFLGGQDAWEDYRYLAS